MTRHVDTAVAIHKNPRTKAAATDKSAMINTIRIFFGSNGASSGNECFHSYGDFRIAN